MLQTSTVSVLFPEGTMPRHKGVCLASPHGASIRHTGVSKTRLGWSLRYRLAGPDTGGTWGGRGEPSLPTSPKRIMCTIVDS